MTDTHSTTKGAAPENPSRGYVQWLVLVATPILLGALFLIHPDGSGGLHGLRSSAGTWLYLHVAMLPLLGSLGVAFYVLLDGYEGTVAAVGRAGVVIYMTFYIAFEAIAGIANGLLVHGTHTLAAEHQKGIAAAVDALAVPSMALGMLGSLGALLAVGAIGILLRRSGAPMVPVVLLGGAPFATVFHAGTPLDAVGMGLFLAGVVWIELRWRSGDEHHATQAT
ncbi:hypothetical protein [Halobellus clavatus]|uniref:Uncharacterized protein n=1 Tax=Halobellus clavatus TaxID=660517 RepID=A0A1H3IBR5_9EURY|nr:hypothetical protein [Halobellus clavatus]SDY24354.1 hypothetical protein SAMN04487946_10976 [Halobellus clavatus]